MSVRLFKEMSLVSVQALSLLASAASGVKKTFAQLLLLMGLAGLHIEALLLRTRALPAGLATGDPLTVPVVQRRAPENEARSSPPMLRRCLPVADSAEGWPCHRDSLLPANELAVSADTRPVLPMLLDVGAGARMLSNRMPVASDMLTGCLELSCMLIAAVPAANTGSVLCCVAALAEAAASKSCWQGAAG